MKKIKLLTNRTVRMLVDTTISSDFYKGVITGLLSNHFEKNILMISSGGINYSLNLLLNSKKVLETEEDFFKSVSVTIRDFEPYFFLCLSEISIADHSLVTPSYFILNQKENNYKVKLIQASKLKQEKAVQINNNLYYDCSLLDPLPLFPIVSDFKPFLGLFVVRKENLKKLVSYLDYVSSTNIIIVEETNSFEDGNDVTNLMINQFINKNKLIKIYKKDSSLLKKYYIVSKSSYIEIPNHKEDDIVKINL